MQPGQAGQRKASPSGHHVVIIGGFGGLYAARIQGLSLLRLAVLGPETVADDAFVSVHPVLGTSLAVGARLLAPLASTDFTDPLDGVVGTKRVRS